MAKAFPTFSDTKHCRRDSDCSVDHGSTGKLQFDNIINSQIMEMNVKLCTDQTIVFISTHCIPGAVGRTFVLLLLTFLL